MDEELLEKQNEDYSKNETLKRKYTVNSIDSAPEFQHKTYLSKIIISISFLSLIIGLFILFNQSYYLNPEYHFPKQKILYYYVLIFTFGLFGVLLTAFFLALLIKLISSIKKCFKSKKNDNNNNDKENIINNEDESEDNFLTQLLQNADNISMIPYTLTICVLLTIILYVIGFPISWYLICYLITNKIYGYISHFFLLYFFIFINSVSGAILIFVSIIFINSRRHNSVRKLSFTYDEDNLISVYKEVRDAIDLGK